MNGEPSRGRRGGWPRRWHRWLGVLFGIPLLWLTVSGLVLRHADRLGLHEKRTKSGWILRKYGMIPDGKASVCEVGNHTVSEWEESLFLNGSLLDESGVLVGAVGNDADVLVATEDFLLVYDPAGALVDQLGEESLPVVPLQAAGLDQDGALVLRGGGKDWRIADDLLTFQDAGTGPVRWSVVSDLPEEARTVLEERLTEQAGISWFRVWLDLHSGNLFGPVGKWAVDLSGVAIIVLTGIGFRLVFRKTRAGR